MKHSTIIVRADWDDEAKVWVATSTDIDGLATEADTLEALRGKVLAMVAELLELKGSTPTFRRFRCISLLNKPPALQIRTFPDGRPRWLVTSVRFASFCKSTAAASSVPERATMRFGGAPSPNATSQSTARSSRVTQPTKS